MSDLVQSRRALLIVDMQRGLFNGAEPPHEGARVLDNINLLIARARATYAPIFAARHTGPKGSPIEPGSALTQLLADLHVDAERDVTFDKTRPSCFAGTGLAQWLRAAKVDELAIVGMKTEYCVDTTCRAASELGWRTVLIEDAHTTTDAPGLGAQAIVAHHNRVLSGPFVKLARAADYVF